MSLKNQSQNPYASAAGAYGTNAQKHSNDPRELEARVLLKSATRMEQLQRDWDGRPADALQDMMKYNRDIWMMFYDTAVENGEGRPQDLRNNIYNLANFVFRREVDILARPEKQKLDILIKINRDIARGLMQGAKNATETAAANAPADVKNPPEGGRDFSA